MDTVAIPLTLQSLLIAGILAVGVPVANAIVTKPDAPAWLKGILSGLLAGAGAVGAYLADVKGVPDWNHVWGLMFVALAGVAAFRNAVDPGIEKVVSDTTQNFGLSSGAGTGVAQRNT